MRSQESGLEDLNVAERGDGPRVVVWLHGFLGSGSEFLPFAESLTGRFRSLLVDLPGHGASPIGEQTSYEGWSGRIRDAVDQRGLKRFDLIGYSMGGRVALDFALRYPGRVRRLVLESTNPGIVDSAARRHRFTSDTLRADRLRSNGLDAFLKQWYGYGVFADLRTQPDTVGALLERRKLNRDSDVARVLRDLSPGNQPSHWKHLPGLSMPSLMIAGERDGKYRSISIRAACQSRSIRRVTVPGVGHNVHMGAPDTYLAIVRRFLEGRVI